MQTILTFRSHPSEDAFERYVFHRLSEEDTAKFEEHLLLCDSCQKTLEQTDRFILLLKAAAEGPVGRCIPLRAAIKPAALGGVLAAVILAIFAIRPEPALSPVPVILASLRGAPSVAMAHAQARHPLDLAIEAADVPPTGAYRLEIVNAFGKPAWNGPLASSAGRLTAVVAIPLDAGIYWVRLYTGDTELLREFGLKLE